MDFLSLPALDAHAHIAPDVTPRQVRMLGDVVVFAMTRSLGEAEEAAASSHANLVWGAGTHPGQSRALAEWDAGRFRALVCNFVLVGEVGLDGRARDTDRQQAVFIEILDALQDQPVMTSIHSTFMSEQVTKLVERYRLRAPILHWFGGTEEDVRRAVAAGAWFSVNAMMRPDVIRTIPPDRVLTETDFPFTRRSGSDKPGAVGPVEGVLSLVWGSNPSDVRRRVWRNLKGLVHQAGVHDRLPEQMATLLGLLA